MTSWTQERMGEYVSTVGDTSYLLQVEVLSSDFFTIRKGEVPLCPDPFALFRDGKKLLDFTKTCTSIDELNTWLGMRQAPPLFVATKATADGKWHDFGTYFSRKVAVNHVQALIPVHFRSTGGYVLHFWDHDYYEESESVEDTFTFVKANGRNPINDLEAEGFEATNHGGSGMDEVHYDLISEQQIIDILAKTYNLHVTKLSFDPNN